jgi:glucose-1-phosphate thymidylyltransferase
MLQFLHDDGILLVDTNVVLENATIIPPCFIGSNVVIKNSTIGPNVSIGSGSEVENSTIKESLIQQHSKIFNAHLDQAMIGNHAIFDGQFKSISIGDYTVIQ